MVLIEDHFADTLMIRGERLTQPVVHTRDHHPADVQPTRRAIREQLGIDTFILSCRQVDVRRGVAHRLLEVEPLDLPGNPRWAETPGSPPRVLDGRGWTRPGWFARAKTWLERQASVGGWLIRTVEQIRTWEFSCVSRVETDQGDMYLKALPRSYAGEVALVQHLATWCPSRVPSVVATNARRRWLLLRGCVGRCLEQGAPLADWRRAARAYAGLQVACVERADRLRGLGCRERPPSALRAALAPLLADRTALMVGEAHGLSSAEFQSLGRWRPWLEAACDDLATGGVPLTLEHGDLWASNIFVGDGEPEFIDWTDACLSHPFLSLAPLLRSASWDAQLRDSTAARNSIGDAYLEAWADYDTPAQLRRALALAEPLAALHTAVSVWSHTPGPHRQWWLPRVVPFFVRMALESLPPNT